MPTFRILAFYSGKALFIISTFYEFLYNFCYSLNTVITVSYCVFLIILLKVIWYFEKNKLINPDFALNLLSWKNSGFSIDNSVRIYGSNDKARESLAQYIARCPVSLEKIKYEPFHGKILFKTPKYNDYFKENFKSFNVLDTPLNLYNWNTTKL